MYQNLIYISRYFGFLLSNFEPLPTTTYLHPYLPLTTSTPIYPYPPPSLPASEQFLQGQWAQVPWTFFSIFTSFWNYNSLVNNRFLHQYEQCHSLGNCSNFLTIEAHEIMMGCVFHTFSKFYLDVNPRLTCANINRNPSDGVAWP